MDERLRKVRYMLNLEGITREEAAECINVTPASLNQKLRGARALTPQEEERLLQLASGKSKSLDASVQFILRR